MLGSRFLKRLASRVGQVITYSSGSTDITKGEQKMQEILTKRFPKAVAIQVKDVSGGCGSMYQIFVETIDFKGKTRIQQHRMITDALGKEISSMHGLVINTQPPEISI